MQQVMDIDQHVQIVDAENEGVVDDSPVMDLDDLIVQQNSDHNQNIFEQYM